MPTALSDPSTTVYAIVGFVVAVLLGTWFRTRKRNDLLRSALAAAALIGLFLIDRFVESPREETTRKMQEMAKATETADWNAFFNHVSNSFKYKSASGAEYSKDSLNEKLKWLKSITEFKGVSVWDFHRADFKLVDGNKVQLGFRAQLRDMPQTQSWVIADFSTDPDGQWRMSGFARYDPVKQDRAAPIGIPGLD